MVFSSLLFIFLFLPVVLFLYYISPRKIRNIILLIASLIFYAWGEPRFLWLMLFLTAANYISGLMMDIKHKAQKSSKSIVIITTIINIGTLIFFKYANFIVDNINSMFAFVGTSTKILLRPIPLPIGISFFIFNSLSYVIDVHKKKVEVQKNYFNLALYVSFFPHMIAGPIVRYKDIADQLTGRKENVDQFSYGIRRFILGLGKKLIVADTVGNVADKVFAISSANLTTPLAWLGIVCYTIQIYYDFSAYSDMGIGLANMFGISFRENFNYPYISKDIKEFWRRWHISLSSWLRDYLYIPLGGSRISKTRTYVNLVIVFFVCGLWHGASWNFIIWGMYYGLFLVLERTSFSKFISWLWTPLRHVYTMLIVLIGWVFFRAETLAYSMQFIKTMFGFGKGSGVENYASMYLNFEVILVIVIGVIGSMPVIPWLIKFKNSNLRLRPVMIVLQDSYLFCVLIVSIIYLGMYLANSMKIPFIYYRF